MSNRDILYLKNIADCIRKIRSYTDNVTEVEFSEQEIIQDAVIRNFEIIGEASKLISVPFKKKSTHIPWKEMAGMHDKLIHNYWGVDSEIIWITIHEVLPELEENIQQLIVINSGNS